MTQGEVLHVQTYFELLEGAWPEAVSRGGLRSFARYLRERADNCDRMQAEHDAAVADDISEVVTP